MKIPKSRLGDIPVAVLDAAFRAPQQAEQEEVQTPCVCISCSCFLVGIRKVMAQVRTRKQAEWCSGGQACDNNANRSSSIPFWKGAWSADPHLSEVPATTACHKWSWELVDHRGSGSLTLDWETLVIQPL